MPIEVLIMWDETNTGCTGYVLVTNDCEILMQKTKLYRDAKEFKNYIKRVFYSNKRFEWHEINIYEIEKHMRLVGIDKK